MAIWKKIREIGRGGNGKVYEVENIKGMKFAMKVLLKANKGKAYSRFKDEVKVLLELKNEPGVIQIVDQFLPETFNYDDPPYYVMPLATSFRKYLENVDNVTFYLLFFQLCQTLVALHSRDITHRDIKPDNILILNDKPVFADFGLANFPEKFKISGQHEKIGPKWTIAPEMERISSVAEFKKADIYSFGKTLWMCITKQWFGFEGQYVPESSISINNYVKIYNNEATLAGEWYYMSTVLLDQLLLDATENDPNKRPDAETFLLKLTFWFESNDDYPKRNPYEWIHAINRIFPVSIPKSAAWEDLDDIINILKILSCDYDTLNHSFYPGQGSFDITNVDFAKEKGCIIFNNWEIVKPKILTFDLVEDLHWSYFRLELWPLEKLNSQWSDENSEEVLMDAVGNYHIIDEYDMNNVFRWFKGTFLIAQKRSPLNLITGEYNSSSGIHDRLTREDYRNFVKDLFILDKNGETKRYPF